MHNIFGTRQEYASLCPLGNPPYFDGFFASFQRAYALPDVFAGASQPLMWVALILVAINMRSGRCRRWRDPAERP